jgi:Zn-dependent peptidase ImmA (M78 family)
MSGLFLQEARIGMVILVNQGHARPRKRFSYAHEYGHALMDRNRAAIVSTSGNSRELSETRANSFAAAFLMPEGGVRSYLANLEKGLNVRQTQAIYDVAGRQGSETEVRAMPGSQKIVYQDAASLARYFGVSYQAAVFRLRDLGVINQGEREALLEQEALGNRYLKVLKFEDAVDSGQYAAEGQREERELISRVAYLAIEAFRREEITGQRVFELAEKLQLDGQELLDLAEAARR